MSQLDVSSPNFILILMIVVQQQVVLYNDQGSKIILKQKGNRQEDCQYVHDEVLYISLWLH